jgi:hypothetical protein
MGFSGIKQQSRWAWPVGIVAFSISAPSEGVTEGNVCADAFGAVGPLQGERNRADETIIGIAQTNAREVPRAFNIAFAKGVEAIQEIVGGCNIMLFQEIEAEVAARNSGEVVDIVDMVDADKGHLLVEMPPFDFAADNIPKVGVCSCSKQASGIQLGYDGEHFVVGRDVALYAITDFVSVA